MWWDAEALGEAEIWWGWNRRILKTFSIIHELLFLSHFDRMEKQQSSPASQSVFQAVGDQVQQLGNDATETEQKLVEEIESFCVNCEQNVRAS